MNRFVIVINLCSKKPTFIQYTGNIDSDDDSNAIRHQHPLLRPPKYKFKPHYVKGIFPRIRNNHNFCPSSNSNQESQQRSCFVLEQLNSSVHDALREYNNNCDSRHYNDKSNGFTFKNAENTKQALLFCKENSEECFVFKKGISKR